MARIVGQERIAEVFGVAPKTIVDWQEQGFPIAVRGGPGVPSEYESADCIRWYVEREVKKIQSESPNDRLSRVKADAIEMDNAERRGKLIPSDLLEPKLKAAFVAAREKFLDAVPRLARELPAELGARETMLQAELEAFLARLADWQKAENVEEEDE
ncbi:terminase small subunit [Thiobacillus sp.]|uniref:terminase small subunit n=1 Tax=Thiobacillus sp. TaxID=924 RepID=UPI0017C4AA06|nr:terminase small subunit [Thiobacillus sp.]MBC2731368.1 terminase small subunit [Thiobacillus sp.]MBC2740105.1 terminase small subunit [Thiobacillus sp.]MBC2758317.1 terminase small subunit [Thiobacillus sp.]